MIDAVIVYGGGRQKMHALIRNLSEGGAKLEVEKVVGVPNTFDLFAPGLGRKSCRVAWRALREMGVQFSD